MSEAHDKITTALFEAGKALTVTEIARETGLGEQNVKFSLRSLRACQHVALVGHDRYRLDNAVRTMMSRGTTTPVSEEEPPRAARPLPRPEGPAESVTQKAARLLEEAEARLGEIEADRARMADRHARERMALQREKEELSRLVRSLGGRAPDLGRGLSKQAAAALDAVRGGATTTMGIAEVVYGDNRRGNAVSQVLYGLLAKGLIRRVGKGTYEAV